jgi:para-nitrobenzyl esterase
MLVSTSSYLDGKNVKFKRKGLICFVLLAALYLIGCEQKQPSKQEVSLDTRLGLIQGFRQHDVLHFLGIRYAEPPIGERRFLPPKITLAWDGLYEATAYSHRCVQAEGGLEGEGTPFQEDCLFLNVFTPDQKGASRPVLFWIHGGGFTQGSANGYDGSVLAAQGDVVVVTINYRLGFLGFSDLSGLGEEFAGSASNGIRDQIAALNWVSENIADYGGDPSNVTIFGESAGGTSVLGLLAAPSADGLFHKAIAHSPGNVNTPSASVVPALETELGLSGDMLVERLYSLGSSEILELQVKVDTPGGRIDGLVITRSTNESIVDRGASGVPLIAGTNRDEGTLFTALIPEEAWEQVGEGIALMVTAGSDPSRYLDGVKLVIPESAERYHELLWNDMFRISAIGAAQRASEAGSGGWLYRFDLPATIPFIGEDFGATHGAEIPFTFNAFAREERSFPGREFLGFEVYDSDNERVTDLATAWSNTVIEFSRTGNPNGAGLPDWPQYQSDRPQTLVLDLDARVESDWEREELARWNRVGISP